MFESKYSNVLTVLLVIIIIAIVGLLGFLGYDLYQKYAISKDTAAYVDEFQDAVADAKENVVADNPMDQVEDTPNGNDGIKTYKGFEVLGTIEIPKTDVKYPILNPGSNQKRAIEVAVAQIYGPGPNQVGNTIIIGHNYRNGLFFSNNKNLSKGDKIYITDLQGNRLEYTIYNKYHTTPEDTEYMTRNTNGAKEISLSTCTDDSKQRIIIWAKAE